MQINLVDTPGTNVILKRQQRLTEEFVPRADLVLFVLSADRPFTESEVLGFDFLCTERKIQEMIFGLCLRKGVIFSLCLYIGPSKFWKNHFGQSYDCALVSVIHLIVHVTGWALRLWKKKQHQDSKRMHEVWIGIE